MILPRDGVLPAPRFTIKDWPEQDRPRERLLSLGPRALSPRELLALLIETGTPPRGNERGRTALDLAGDLLAWFAKEGGAKSPLRRLMTASLAELCEVPGIGPAKAAKVQAALELGRRAIEEARPDRDRVTTARDIYERMRLSMRDLPQEELHALLLNTQNEILRDVLVTRGTADGTLAHARDVFRAALVEAAMSVVLVHNHPSGEPAPSPEDRALTRELVAAGAMVGIPVVDHVIIGEGRYVSFAEEGILNR